MKKAITNGQVGKDTEALKLFLSLVGLPTLYEGPGDDAAGGLVWQAIRQNVKGSYIQPLSCVQWAHLCLMTHYPRAETRL